jgi:multiple sugar transport system permease protein
MSTTTTLPERGPEGGALLKPLPDEGEPERRRFLFSGWHLVLLPLAFVMIAPMLWMLVTSIETYSETQQFPPILAPSGVRWQNYRQVLELSRFPRWFVNTVVVTSVVVVANLFFCSLAGYAFARLRFFGRDVVFVILLATMMIPFQVIMIPLYLILVQLNLTDNLAGLIIPAAASAFGIFLMKQFIEGIPGELIDAARIGGTSEFGIFARIIMPQMGPALATLGIFQFMGTWNDYLWPLIVIKTTEQRTLPIMLTWYNTQHGARQDLTMAASVLVILPILIVYFIFQRRITQGIALTGFK